MKALIYVVFLGLTPALYGQTMATRSEAHFFGFGVPVYVGEEYGAKLEYNLGDAVLGLELFHVAKGEEFSEEVVKKEGRSLITEGYEGAIEFSRFSQPQVMGGFFWMLGAGYRVLEAVWKRPYGADSAYGVTYDSDEDGLVSELTASGVTGHGRLGYRYVMESLPVSIGGLIGVRHFENKFEQKEKGSGAQTTEEERYELKQIVMTRPEIAVELGVVF